MVRRWNLESSLLVFFFEDSWALSVRRWISLMGDFQRLHLWGSNTSDVDLERLLRFTSRICFCYFRDLTDLWGRGDSRANLWVNIQIQLPSYSNAYIYRQNSPPKYINLLPFKIHNLEGISEVCASGCWRHANTETFFWMQDHRNKWLPHCTPRCCREISGCNPDSFRRASTKTYSRPRPNIWEKPHKIFFTASGVYEKQGWSNLINETLLQCSA